MKKIFAIALVFAFMMMSVAHAQDETYNEKLIKDAPIAPGKALKVDEKIGQFAQNWLTNYKIIALLLCGIAIVITVLVYMAGSMMQSDELKVLARSEVMQAIATMLIVIIVVGSVVFFDTLLEGTLSSSGFSSPCPPGTKNAGGQSLALLYSGCYADNLFGMARAQGEGALRESIDAGKAAYRNIGYQSDNQELIYSGMNVRPQAWKRIIMEVKGVEFQFLSNIMISLSAQAKFLNQIIPALGPSALLLGIILRSLFFTRKYGGLLIAIGLALMLVFPAAYMLAWVTLQVAVFGPQIAGTGESNPTCPTECKVLPPLAYCINENAKGPFADKYCTAANANGEYAPASKISDANFKTWLDKTNNDRVMDAKASITLGSEKILKDEYGVQTCFPKYSSAEKNMLSAEQSKLITAFENCPIDCRYIPTPAALQCNTTACDMVPNACKFIRAMGAKNYTDTYKANDEYCLSASGGNCGESTCPSFCKLKTQEVKYSSGTVVPSDNAGKCNVDKKTNEPDKCDACPSHCRQYFTDLKENANYRLISNEADDCNNDNCKACLDKVDSTDSAPDCLQGVPIVMYKECNGDGVCGPALPMSSVAEFDAQTGQVTKMKMAGVCPLECRIFYDDKDAKYKDPFYANLCLNKDMKDACSTCPNSCRVNASSVGASGSYDKVMGSTTIKCAQAPSFTDKSAGGACTQITKPENCKMDGTGDCLRCPLSCRFTNPSSINDQTSGYNPFKSSVQYPIDCQYYTDSQGGSGKSWVNIEYVKYNANNAVCLYSEPGVSGTIAKDDLTPKLPTCSPSKKVYKGYESNSPLCPAYAADDDNYIFTSSKQKGTNADGSTYYSITIRPNQDASAECTDEMVQKFCADPYCTSKCKVDRSQKGPYVCNAIVDDQYSVLVNNSRYCKDCYTINSAYTQGPQCQVYLIEADGTLHMPAGCDPKCAAGMLASNNPRNVVNANINPSATVGCTGFCYPRLAIPSTTSTCQNYDSANAGNGNRSMKNGAACPAECRYDYVIDKSGNQKISTDAMNKCAYSLTFSVAPKNCDTKCDGTIYTSTNRDWCAVPTNANAQCTQGRSITRWVNITPSTNPLPRAVKFYKDVNLRDDCPCLNKDGTKNLVACADGNVDHKYDDVCKRDGVVYQNITNIEVYSCARQHKYIGWDDLVDDTIKGYIECGIISGGVGTNNPEYNFCGSNVLPGGQTITGMQSTCKASYNARAVECLPYASYDSDMSTPGAKQSIAANENCQQCPTFLRIEGIDAPDPWLYGGITPACTQSECAKSPTIKADNPANSPPGYCGVKKSEFKLVEDGGSCAMPITGSGVGCPARCRIKMPDGSVPAGCDSGEIMTACATENMYDACKADPSQPPCAGCVSCEDDCRSVPYVRQDCSELCEPLDLTSGRSDMTMSDLTSSYKGASASQTGWQAIGSLMIPAIILPIFVIIMAIAFIRILSPLLGGDIEIPGLFKLI
ncbi:MAG: hypothetical protein WC492_00920 [Candidatus Micrarchaeia archaeon]